MAGPMRLAVKYEVDSIRDLIKHHIEADWPHTLYEWELWQSRISHLTEVVEDDSDAPPLAAQLPEPVSALLFATEFGCHSILPTLFYYLTAGGIEFARLETDWDNYFNESG